MRAVTAPGCSITFCVACWQPKGAAGCLTAGWGGAAARTGCTRRSGRRPGWTGHAGARSTSPRSPCCRPPRCSRRRQSRRSMPQVCRRPPQGRKARPQVPRARPQRLRARRWRWARPWPPPRGRPAAAGLPRAHPRLRRRWSPRRAQSALAPAAQQPQCTIGTGELWPERGAAVFGLFVLWTGGSGPPPQGAGETAGRRPGAQSSACWEHGVGTGKAHQAGHADAARRARVPLAQRECARVQHRAGRQACQRLLQRPRARQPPAAPLARLAQHRLRVARACRPRGRVGAPVPAPSPAKGSPACLHSPLPAVRGTCRAALALRHCRGPAGCQGACSGAPVALRAVTAGQERVQPGPWAHCGAGSSERARRPRPAWRPAPRPPPARPGRWPWPAGGARPCGSWRPRLSRWRRPQTGPMRTPHLRQRRCLLQPVRVHSVATSVAEA